MSKSIRINGREVGPGAPTYLIAEMSCNHGGDFSTAIKILEEAKAAGADAVKIQTYTADTLTIPSDQEWFRIGKGSLWEGRRLYDLYSEAATPWEWHPRLKEAAARLGLDFFSSPFDPSAVDFLEKQGVPCYKIASFEIVDIPLIRRVAQTGKPLIISTGIATREDIEMAVKEARSHGAKEIALLKCTSAYPAPPDEMNLRAIPALAQAFDVPVGLSDHTLGSAAAIASIALGACIIEKHLIPSRKRGGPDSAFSMEPAEFKAMAQSVREAERALGRETYSLGREEEKSRIFRRSLFVVQDVKQGEALTAENVRSIRPGNGLPPKHYWDVLGRKAAKPIARGTPLSWDLIEPNKS